MATEGARPRRVGESIRRELAPLLDDIARDKRLGLVSITSVDVSPDLRQATCYVAPLGAQDPAPLVKALTRVRGYLRGQLSKEVTFKFTPDLTFQPDTSFDQADAVDKLLHSPEVARDLSHDDEAQGGGE